MDCAAWRAGYAHLERHGLHFDLQTPWWHFEAAAVLARDFPRSLIIINHTGLPADRSPEGIAGWRRALELMAHEPNTCLKISGLGTHDKSWTVALNGQVVRDAISIFGAERSMFASNFPVDSLVATFDDIFDGFDAITAKLDVRTRRRLFHETAAEVYRPVMPQQP